MCEHASELVWWSQVTCRPVGPGMRLRSSVWTGSAFPHGTIVSSLQVTSLKPKTSKGGWRGGGGGGKHRLPLHIPEGSEKRKTLPGTFWMIFATKALKWHRISFRVSESFSFSASRSCRVKSTYSKRVLLRKWVSLSRPPLALRRGKKTERRCDSQFQMKWPPSEGHAANLVCLWQNDTLKTERSIKGTWFLASLCLNSRWCFFTELELQFISSNFVPNFYKN